METLGPSSYFNPKLSFKDNINNALDDDTSTALQEFYNGANVLVTGATGFMGKVLVEKLLRTCSNINRIYILVRSKKGKNVDERIEEMIKSACFDRLKEEHINIKSRLFAVEGDISIVGLGMREQDRQLLAQNVTIVFHLAATVRFDEQLNRAIKLNVRGTRDLILLCKTFTKLKSMISVSTAYSNCPSSEINECFYDPPITCDRAIEMAEQIEDTTMDAMKEKLLGKWPNSYAFTKLIAEDVVKKYGSGLPIAVFRPAIVICSYQEPEPGWVDTSYGPSGVYAGVATGIIRTVQTDCKIPTSLIPCDLVINGIIASAWDAQEKRKTSQDIPVYNYTGCHENPITWRGYYENCRMYYIEKPSNQAIWYLMFILVANKTLAQILRFFLHILPAAIMDFALLVSYKKPHMLRLYKKIHGFLDVVTYFSTHCWRFEETNMTDLYNKMDAVDKTLFPLDMRSLNWQHFCQVTTPGLRKNLLKEDETNLREARTKMFWLYCLHLSTQVILLSTTLWLGIKIFAFTARMFP